MCVNICISLGLYVSVCILCASAGFQRQQLCQHTQFFRYTELYDFTCPCVTTHRHKTSFLHRVQQTDPQLFSFVVHGDHVEGYCLWHSEDDGQYPDQRYLDSHPLRNSNPFNTAPRGHSAIPEGANTYSQ